MIKRSREPEAAVVVPVEGGVEAAEGRAEGPWIAAPGTAAKDTAIAIITSSSRRAVVWRSDIVVLVAILNPLPDIAVHIVHAEGVCRKAADRRRIHPLVRRFGQTITALVLAVVGLLVAGAVAQE